MTQIAILILAAGASARMGGSDKLLEDVGGESLLARVAARACDTGFPVLIAVPDVDHPRARIATLAGALAIPVPDHPDGMGASIRTGVAALPQESDGVMILPADMPDLQSGDLREIASAFAAAPQSIIRATTQDGQPGHPVIFPAILFGDLAQIGGDTGARSVIAAHKDRLRDHPLRGDRATCDLDTPLDWINWRAAQSPH